MRNCLPSDTSPLLVLRVSWKGSERFLSTVRWATKNLLSFLFGFCNFSYMFQCNFNNSDSCNCNKEDFSFNNSLYIDIFGKRADRRLNLLWYEKILLHFPSNTTICSTNVRRLSLKTVTWNSSLLLFFPSTNGHSFSRGPITSQTFCLIFSKFYQSWFHLTGSYPLN